MSIFKSNNSMHETCTRNRQICASCRWWGGPRVQNAFNINYSNDSGRCGNRKSSTGMGSKQPRQSCSVWESM